MKHVFPACPSLYIFAAFKINVIMLSKEEISEVISYCQEHGCSYKDRLTELGIAEWKFYDSKYRYAIQERKIKESGQFLQLKPSSDGSFVPFPSLDSPKTGRKEDKQKCAQRSMLSIELQTSNGTMMRIQGDMSPEHLAAISYAS